MIDEADKKIAILQYIIVLDLQESNEDQQLKNWKKHRILLTSVDVNRENIVFSDNP
ncbi:tail fiber assembly protein [Candidatus Schmidhempelia bombi]|uniref:Tail fiber assembly protein n=1 Tax=Candidatus Schmidhempelia bombi str. Bimp TaxID=1387197 RepID=A0AB94IEP3_9GAMM|nr:hypothetical protein O970_00730 [Candidatus Schmidhempelia bombi str. Bimp]